MAKKTTGRSSPKKAAAPVVTTFAGQKVAESELAHIAPALRPFAVRLDSLSRDPNNARLHPEQNQAATTRSLKRFGQQLLILFDERRTIRVGNGRHEAGESLGWQWIAAAPTNLRGAELKAYALADNRSSELGEWYRAEFERQLDQLKSEIPDLDTLDIGFSSDQIDALLKDVPDVKTAHAFASDPAGEISARGSGGHGGGGGGSSGDEPEKIFNIIIKAKDEADHAKWIEELESRADELATRGSSYAAPSM